MKNTFIIVTILTLGLGACKKEYTCQCWRTTRPKSEGTNDTKIKAKNRTEATAKCLENTKVPSPDGVSCELK